jgi:hypothetical protein
MMLKKTLFVLVGQKNAQKSFERSTWAYFWPSYPIFAFFGYFLLVKALDKRVGGRSLFWGRKGGSELTRCKLQLYVHGTKYSNSQRFPLIISVRPKRPPKPDRLRGLYHLPAGRRRPHGPPPHALPQDHATADHKWQDQLGQVLRGRGRRHLLQHVHRSLKAAPLPDANHTQGPEGRWKFE